MTELHSSDHANTELSEVTILRPPSRFSLGLLELWQYKELLYYFFWREYKIRYRQTLLGILWTLLQPSLMAFMFMVLLSMGLRIGPSGWDGVLFFYSGMLVWQFFSQTVSQATQSVVNQSAMIQKVYFPRLILPVSAAINASLDFLLQSALLLFFMAISGREIMLFPFFLGLLSAFSIALITSTGIGCLLSALNVRYKDVRYALPFLIQCIFFLTPVLYNVATIQHAWVKPLIQMNPLSLAASNLRTGMTGAIPAFLSGETLLPFTLGILLFLAGLFVFKKNESSFADNL